MKILSWNINGLRTQKHNLKTLLDGLDSDIICLQETKITRDQLEESLAIIEGYHSFFSFSRKRSGYSGVVTYCKRNACPSYAQEGLAGILGVGCLKGECGSVDSLPHHWNRKDLKDLDAEGRCIITQHPFQDKVGHNQIVTVINVYCPRADPDRPERATFKLSFYELLRQRASVVKWKGSHVIILGDVNTSHRMIDHCDPGDEEDFLMRPDRLFLNQFLVSLKDCADSDDEETVGVQDLRVVDTFRYFHPDQREAFTCWNTHVNARATNYGTRIDYVFCDKDILPFVEDSLIHPDIQGSDHCPVSVRLHGVHFLSSANDIPPSMCTRFYPEFRGSQQKLSSYFGAHPYKGQPSLGPNGEVNCAKWNPNKRSAIETRPGNNCKKRKGDSQGKQLTLTSLIIKPRDLLPIISDPATDSPKADESPPRLHNSVQECLVTMDKKGVVVHKNSSSPWNFLMKGPPPPPLCSGHQEPSVLRTVRKKGPNLNRQFYSCARGQGREGDPNAHCNFFKWLISKSR